MAPDVVNPVHRNHPVKEFFQQPKVKMALKVTAVALATLAVFGGVIALSVFIAPAFAAIAIPVTLVSLTLIALIVKKSPEQVRFETAKTVVRMHKEGLTELMNEKLEAIKTIENRYRNTIKDLKNHYQDYRQVEDDPLPAAEAVNKLLGNIEVLEGFYKLADKVGVGCSFAEIHDETQLASCLIAIVQNADEKADHPAIPYQALSNAIRTFAMKHNIDLTKKAEVDSAEQESVEALHDDAEVDSAEQERIEALHDAAKGPNRDEKAFEAALAAVRNPSAKDEHGNTAMHYAAINGFSGAIQMLHDRGVPIDVVNKVGSTPFAKLALHLLENDITSKQELAEVKEILVIFEASNNQNGPKKLFAIPAEILTERDFLKDAMNMLLGLGAVADGLLVNYCRIKIKGHSSPEKNVLPS